MFNFLSRLYIEKKAENGILSSIFFMITGKGLANPTAMLLSTASMLDHLGLINERDLLRSAINRVLTDGKIRTRDIGGYASTQQFTNAVINCI